MKAEKVIAEERSSAEELPSFVLLSSIYHHPRPAPEPCPPQSRALQLSHRTSPTSHSNSLPNQNKFPSPRQQQQPPPILPLQPLQPQTQQLAQLKPLKRDLATSGIRRRERHWTRMIQGLTGIRRSSRGRKEGGGIRLGLMGLIGSESIGLG